MRSTVDPPERFVSVGFTDESDAGGVIVRGYVPATASMDRALVASRRMAEGEIGSLVLTGKTGTGKTHLAAAIWHAYGSRLRTIEEAAAEAHRIANATHIEAERIRREAMTEGERYNEDWLAAQERLTRKRYRDPEKMRSQRPMWLNVASTIVALRAEIGADERATAATLETASETGGLVVLDDLGQEKTSDWTSETIYALVNARYESMLPTIVTTNLTGSELATSTYWPVISRLAEDGELVRIEGADHRLAKHSKGAPR